MSKGFRKKTEGGAWQTMWAIHQQLNKDDGNNKYSLKKRGKDFFLKKQFLFKKIFNSNFVLLSD